jgi:uncharacterized membrane protein YkvA (DUF1232 family)
MAEQRSITVVDQSFDDGAFWEKLRRFATRAGRIVVERALRLYYASLDPRTPPWARRAIYAALAYFVMPFDLIPDFIPVAGQLDDALVVAAGLAYVVRVAGREVVEELWTGSERGLSAVLRLTRR